MNERNKDLGVRVREVFSFLATLLSIASCVALAGGLVYLLCREPGRVPDESQPDGRETEVYEDLKPGDRYVKGFPMMDQGRLPWCQIYTLARVLKYYGVEVSPEEAARELQVDENRAPDVEDVKFLMDELCEDVGLRHVELMPEFQFDEEFKADYNRIASEKRKFGLSVCTSPQTNSQGRCTWMLDAGLLAMQIDLEILTEYWNRHRPERFELFMDAVVRPFLEFPAEQEFRRAPMFSGGGQLKILSPVHERVSHTDKSEEELTH